MFLLCLSSFSISFSCTKVAYCWSIFGSAKTGSRKKGNMVSWCSDLIRLRFILSGNGFAMTIRPWIESP